MTDCGITQNQILSRSTVSLGDACVDQNSELRYLNKEFLYFRVLYAQFVICLFERTLV